MPLSESIAVLAATLPPGASKDLLSLARQKLKPSDVNTFNAINAWREIAKLEAQLGLEVSNPIYNLGKSAARLAELKAMLPKTTELAKAAPAVSAPVALAAPAVTPTNLDAPTPTASLAEFYKMDSATRTQFAADGGALAKSDFDRLTFSAKSKFCVAGGKIIDDRPANFRNRCTAAASFGSNS